MKYIDYIKMNLFCYEIMILKINMNFHYIIILKIQILE